MKPRNRQQCFRRAAGFAGAAFPFADGGEGDAEHGGEVLLGEIEFVTDFGGFGFSLPSAGLFAAVGFGVYFHSAHCPTWEVGDFLHANYCVPFTGSAPHPTCQLAGFDFSFPKTEAFIRLRADPYCPHPFSHESTGQIKGGVRAVA